MGKEMITFFSAWDEGVEKNRYIYEVFMLHPFVLMTGKDNDKVVSIQATKPHVRVDM